MRFVVSFFFHILFEQLCAPIRISLELNRIELSPFRFTFLVLEFILLTAKFALFLHFHICTFCASVIVTFFFLHFHFSAARASSIVYWQMSKNKPRRLLKNCSSVAIHNIEKTLKCKTNERRLEWYGLITTQIFKRRGARLSKYARDKDYREWAK